MATRYFVIYESASQAHKKNKLRRTKFSIKILLRYTNRAGLLKKQNKKRYRIVVMPLSMCILQCNQYIVHLPSFYVMIYVDVVDTSE
jgi:hypothetical protein